MSKKWFDTAFLPSLFEYAGIENSKKISVKQADVFLRQKGVDSRQHTNLSYYGEAYVVCSTYTYEWDGREVVVYADRSGYTIRFSMNDGEKKQYLESVAKKRDEKDIAMYSKMRAKHIEKYSRYLKEAEDELIESIKIIDASAASEDEEHFNFDMDCFFCAEKEYYKIYFA